MKMTTICHSRVHRFEMVQQAREFIIHQVSEQLKTDPYRIDLHKATILTEGEDLERHEVVIYTNALIEDDELQRRNRRALPFNKLLKHMSDISKYIH